MNKNVKVISSVLAAAMAVSVVPAMNVSAAGEARKLISLDFNDANDRLKTENGSALAQGNLSYGTGEDGSDCVYFDGTGSGWIDLKNDDGKGLLAGKDNVTIAFSTKTESAPSWWLYAAPDSTAPVYKYEEYLGFLDNNDSISIERYKNNGGRAGTVDADYSKGGWKDIVVSMNGTTTDLYVNGNFAGSYDYSYSLSDILGDNPITYIGKATWGSGEYAKGYLDNFVVYDCDIIPDIGDTSAVTHDLDLPTEGDGYTIEWHSSNQDVLSDDGKVTRPEEGKHAVTLTATIKLDDLTLTRNYDMYVVGDHYYDYKLNVKNEKGVDIQDNMYGLFFEDINYAADGGLYAEMIENRSFESLKSNGKGGTSYDGQYGWSVYPSDASGATVTMQSSGGLNENNTHYAEFTASATQKGLRNQAYDGVYIEAGKTYNVSVYAKKGTYSGPVKAQIYSGGNLVAETVLTESLSDEWTKYEAKLTSDQTVRYADFVIALDGAGSVSLDMVSCIPDDAIDGVFRKDLAEKLKALHPGFLRFPGGCIIEGYNLDNRYNWKDSVGSVEERKQNWSRWSAHINSGLDGGFKHYNQTYGIGYFEYFELCEYLECDPVPVVNVGLACEYQSKETVPVFEADGVTYTDEFYQYIQDTLDLIEFANGDTSTKWGSLRAEMGHPEPFNLTMIGIGNEQWYISGNQWYERYEAFEKEIHKEYPDIKLISTSGPSASGDSFDDAWSWIRENDSENDNFTYAVDEHYYMSPEWFLSNDTRYDNYDRGTKVFAGEYAAHTTLTDNAAEKNNVESAVAEAAFMTGLERNADVVYMASYAPLFARLNYTQWAPDMIWFDDASSYVTPTYYVQSMYMNNNGDYTLESNVTESTGKTYQSVSYDEESGDIIIKIANPTEDAQVVNIALDDSFDLEGTASAEVLSGNSLTDVNSIDNSDNVSPEKTEISVSDLNEYSLAPLSFTVLRVRTNKGMVTLNECKPGNGVITYNISENTDLSDYDVYAAAYDKDGQLLDIKKNELSGEVKTGTDSKYTFKVMVWNKDGMTPQTDVIERTVSMADQIMEYKYAFTDARVIKSGGSASQGEVYEWAITSVPQYFYIDNIDFDALDTIILRSGYQTNSATMSFYAYDSNGAKVSADQLNSFVNDPSPLGEPVASFTENNTGSWGYRTAEINSDRVIFTEGTSYILGESKPLSVPENTGKKALIVGITGNIGTKGYFDHITVKYNKEVDAPMPDIKSITGDGIKDNTVEVDDFNKTILIPVVPGTDLSTLDATITMDGNASAELTSGTWADGEVTITYGGTTEVWKVTAEDRGNPVLNGYYADPNITVFGDTFYIYPTTDGGSGWNSTYFKAFSSKDLVNWKDEGIILKLGDVSWSSGVYCWAPTVAEKNGKYYFYYSGEDKNSSTKRLGVAVSDSPTGPFVDKGEPLVRGGNLTGQMIDPAVFTDDDGQSYLYWGNGRMYAAKLSDDMMNIEGEIKEITPSNFREGAFVIKRNGIYYFMWSDNDTGEPTYEVHYGTSTSPLGPINGDTKILSYSNTDDSRIRGTGHHSVVNVPGTDEWYICYHRFNLPRYGTVTSKNSEAGNHREVCIDKLEFDDQGNIKPVKATLKGITEPVTIGE